MVILKLTLRTWGVGHFNMEWTSGCYKRWGIYWLLYLFSAFQVEHHSVERVSYRLWSSLTSHRLNIPTHSMMKKPKDNSILDIWMVFCAQRVLRLFPCCMWVQSVLLGGFSAAHPGNLAIYILFSQIFYFKTCYRYWLFVILHLTSRNRVCTWI
jgi:hypothetical protein